jgi:hypothetical protein
MGEIDPTKNICFHFARFLRWEHEKAPHVEGLR